jgi:hypothetical protein
MSAPRAFTTEEELRMLIRHIRYMATYWAKIPDISKQEACDGVAFSILAALDGSSPAVPAYHLTVSVHESDEAYHKKQGENWHAGGLKITESVHLHELYYDQKRLSKS